MFFRRDPDGTIEWVWRWGRVLARAWTRVHVVGIEHVPRHGPVILAANHRSHADIPALVGALERRVVFPANEQLWSAPVLGFVLESQACPRVTHTGIDRAALEQSLHLLKLGRVLAVFAEGGLRPDGLDDFEEGAAYLAVRSGAPVVPAGIAGSREAWRQGECPPIRSRQVCMAVGEAMRPDPALPRRRATEELTARMHRKVAVLVARAERIRADVMGQPRKSS